MTGIPVFQIPISNSVKAAQWYILLHSYNPLIHILGVAQMYLYL